MDRFIKRIPRDCVAEELVEKKRRRIDASGIYGKSDPKSICIWNCNGLPVRLGQKRDRDELVSFIKYIDLDVICFSEVRCSAFCANKSAKRNDGTARDRQRFSTSTPTGLKDRELFDKFMNEPELASYKAYISLADWKYAGTSVLVNRAKVAEPKIIRFNLDTDSESEEHDPNGRVILLRFKHFALLHTYSPNNGWDIDDFARRKAWDECVRRFVQYYKSSGIALIWAGDLNIAPTDCDLSHPDYFKRQVKKPKFGQPRESPPAAENVGQPGCTRAERERLGEILRSGGLIDFYRLSEKTSENSASSDDSKYSWRGSADGKYYGRGMRIDHFFGSESLADRVESVTITGNGIERKGFLGSDHCPVLLQLKSDLEPGAEKALC